MRFFAAAALILGACTTSSTGTEAPLAGDVIVFAASSLTDAFEQLADGVKKTSPGAHFTFNFGSSSTLATQIVNGAPADVFASADEGTMQKVVRADLTEGDPKTFAANQLAIAVAAGNPKKIAGLTDLTRSDVVLVLAAPTVPAGRYALEALARAGVAARPASQEIDVRAVLNKVSLGEADAGIVYVTDVRSAQRRVTGIEIPPADQVVVNYPVALVKRTRNAPLANKFIDYLVSPDGQKILAEFGFSKP